MSDERGINLKLFKLSFLMERLEEWAESKLLESPGSKPRETTYYQTQSWLLSELRKADEKLAIAKEALKFYAPQTEEIDEDGLQGTLIDVTDAMFEDGEIAREALAKIEKFK